MNYYPHVSVYPPSLYRVYKSTVQRVPLSVKSLNSHAAFLVIGDDDRQVIAWVGSDCLPADKDLAKTVGLGVLHKDFRLTDVRDLPMIIEHAEIVPILEAAMDIIGSSMNSYTSKLSAADRKHALENESVSVGTIEKSIEDESEPYFFQETSFAHPDPNGTVPRVNFAPIEKDSAVFVHIGDQWDLWFARGVSDEDQRGIRAFVEEDIISYTPFDSAAAKERILSQFINVIQQGEESYLFRRPLKIFTDFLPPGKTLPPPEKNYSANFQSSMTPAPNADSSDSVEAIEKIKDLENTKTGFGAEDNGEDKTEDDAKQGEVILGAGLELSERPLADQAITERDEKKDPSDESKKAFGGLFQSSFMDKIPKLEDPVSLSRDKDLDLSFWEGGQQRSSAGRKAGPSSVEEGRQEDDLAAFKAFPLPSNALKELAEPPLLEDPIEVRRDEDTEITEEMLQISDGYTLKPEKRKELLLLAADDPSVLIGWQVEVDEGLFAGVFIVKEVKKSPMWRKSLFHLCSTDDDDFWTRVKRGNMKKGLRVRPLRKILQYVD